MFTAQQWDLAFAVTFSFSVAWVIHLIESSAPSARSSGQCKSQITTNARFWNLFGIQNAFEAIRAVKNGTMLSYMDKFWDRYGDTYTINILGTRVIFTRDAANIRQIFSIQWLDYDVAKGIRTEMFKHVAPGTIAATDGKEWEDNRRKWRQSLAHHDQLLDLPFLEKSFGLFTRRIDVGKVVDLQPLVLDLLTDIIRNFAVGESTHCLDTENQSKETRESLEALKHASTTMVIQGLLGPLSWLIPSREFQANCRFFKRSLSRTIRERMNMRKNEQTDPQAHSLRKSTFLDRLSSHTNDPQTLNNDITAALLAAESMARSLSHTIWLLCRHPNVYGKLRQSILEVAGFHEPTYEQLNKFVYVRSVLTESLRLLPPTSLTLRRANKDTWLPKGGGSDGTESLLICKGQRVFISIFGTQRNPANFGEDACDFRPERWEHLSTNTPGFMAFSRGPRSCSGQSLAYHILTYLLVRFIQTYSSIEDRNEKTLTTRVEISMTNSNGVWVAMTPNLQGI